MAIGCQGTPVDLGDTPTLYEIVKKCIGFSNYDTRNKSRTSKRVEAQAAQSLIVT